nr:Synerg-CTERM sorting domain-containing protein [uncultured Dethiosulfovibrio sp.]
MGRRARLFCAALTVFALLGCFMGDRGDAWSSGDRITVELGLGESAKSFDLGEVAGSAFWAEPPVPSGHTCMNRGMTFRLLQSLADRQCEDGVLRPFDLDVRLGWQFGCATKIYNGYVPIVLSGDSYVGIRDQNGDYVVRPGIFKVWDYSLDSRPTSGEVSPSSLYRIEATSRSTGKVYALNLKDQAFPDNFFSVRQKWIEEVYPKEQAGQALSDEEKVLDELWHKLQEDALATVVSADQGDFAVKVLNEGCPFSGFVKNGVLSFRSKDGSLKELQMVDACMEGEGDQRHPCLCRAMAYRVAQIASSAWSDGIFDVNDVKVETGWNSDGPKELFVDLMGLPSVTYGVKGKISSPDSMSLADCWYRVTVLSTGESFVFRGTERMLPSDFMVLRNKVKGGSATPEEQKALRQSKAIIMASVQRDGFYGGFEIRKAPKPLAISDVLVSGDLRYLSVDGKKVETLSLPDGVLEDDGKGGTKICLCQAMAFRVSQMMSHRWADGIFRPNDVSIETGWNSDGPSEFWVDRMGMDPKDVAISSNATSGSELSVSDGWYKVTVKSTGETFSFRATSDIYLSDFLDLRALAKQGKISDAQKKRQMALRKRIENRVLASPYVSLFKVEEPSSVIAQPVPALSSNGVPVLPRAITDEERKKCAGLAGKEGDRVFAYDIDEPGSSWEGSLEIGSGDVTVMAESGNGLKAMTIDESKGEINSSAVKSFAIKIEANGPFDLNHENAGVQAKIFVQESVAKTEEGVSSSSGGCSIGLSPWGLALLGVPLIFMKNRHKN